MKKRLRKKLHKEEFQELGFELEFDYLGDSSNADEMIDFYEEMDEFINKMGIEAIGGIGKHWSCFVTHIGRGTITEQQRQAVIDWLEQRPNVTNITVGPLRDAWYGWDDE